MTSTSWQTRLVSAVSRRVLKPTAFPLEPTAANLRPRRTLSRLLERLIPYPWGLSIEPVALPRCRADWVTTDPARTGRVILHLHGGGYCVLSPRMFRDYNAKLGDAAGARVLSVDYREGPDQPFSASLDDVVDAYRYLLDAGHRSQDIVIAGESAGAHLTLRLVLALRDRGLPRPAGAIVVSPWVNLACEYPSIDENRDRDVLLHPDALRGLARFHARGLDLRHPEISPAFADFRDIPPLFVLVSECELVRDDARAARDLAHAAGVTVRYLEVPDMPHAWAAWPMLLPEARQAVREMADFIREVTPQRDGVEAVRR